MMQDYSSFGEWVKAQRLALHFTRKQLADRVNCAPITLRKIEEDARRPSPLLAEALANQLNLPPEQVRVFMMWAQDVTATCLLPVPLASVPPAKVRPHAGRHLPTPLTSFIGRNHEVRAIQALLQQADVRLLTLVGPPGVGKTRLSCQAVADLPDGTRSATVFIALAAVRDAALLVATVAHALGLREVAGQSLTESLKAYLSDHPILLVLDNFEQVSVAAPLLTDWLESAAGLKMLVTSRVVLGLYGEQVFLVPPLTVPDATHPCRIEELQQSEAIRLFVARAQAACSDFRLTAENAPTVAAICWRLDGLPLAIELAAGQSRILSPASILTRLDQRLPLPVNAPTNLSLRQRSLRGALDWSYDLLPKTVKQLFRRLAVFGGSYNLEVVDAVCSGAPYVATRGAEELFNQLLTLVNHSLLLVDMSSDPNPRFHMLETIREYALDRLEEDEEARQVQERFLRFFLQLAEQARIELLGAQSLRWLERLELEHANFQNALTWALEQDSRSGLQLATALGQFWQLHGHFIVGRRRLTELLRVADKGLAENAAALYEAGRLAYYQGDYSAARAFSTESLTLADQRGNSQISTVARCQLGLIAYREGDYPTARQHLVASQAQARAIGDTNSRAEAVLVLGHLARSEGDYMLGQTLYKTSLQLYRQLGNRYGIALALNGLGNVALRQWNYPAAAQLLEEALVIQRELHDPWSTALTLSWLGDLALAQTEYSTAQSLFEESLALHRTLGNKWGTALALLNLGEVARCRHEYELAWALNQESLRLNQEVGNKESAASALHNLGHLAQRRGDWHQAVALLTDSLTLFRTLGDRLGIIACLAGLAGVHVHREDWRQGAQLLGAVDHLAKIVEAQLEPADQLVYDQNLGIIQHALSREELAVSWLVGQQMSMEQACDDALQLAASASSEQKDSPVTEVDPCIFG